MDDIFAILLIVIVIPIGFFIGKLTDVYWRIKQQRRFQKKDYHIAAIVSKDKKAIKHKIFLPEESTIWHDGQVWTVESNRIYRQDKPDDGFVMTEKNIRWEEGIPVLYIDEESFRPLDFDFIHVTNAKPGEAGAILKSWVVNQWAKALATMKRQETYILIIIGLALIAAAFGYLNNTAIAEVRTTTLSINQTVNDMHDQIMPPISAAIPSPTGGG